MKITIIGAGAVGATCADNIIRKELASEVVLLDVRENFAEGKALDIYQTSSLLEFDTKITGTTNDYSKTADSEVTVITSGMPRKPGMTREELIGVNEEIVKNVVSNVLQYSPKTKIIIVSNPMDTMTYLANQISKLPSNQIIGMGGILDSARFKCYLSLELKCSTNDVQAMVIGGHGDTTMIPLIRKSYYQCIPITDLMGIEQQKKVISETMIGGATLTKLLGTSAWYAPGAAVSVLVESIVRNQKKIFPCCVMLNGEYGQNDICLGVPVIVGKNGWESIIDLKLNKEEQDSFNKSAEAVRSMNNILKTI